MDNMERRQNEELLEARRLRRQEQKRRLLMRQRVLAVVLLVIVILSLILILRGCRNRREHPELYVKKDSALELQTEPDATVNIAAVGDIMITDDLLADAKQPDGSYTPKMKLSESVEKMTIPCLKKVWRIYDEDGKAQADLITMADEVVDTKNGITLFDPIETWKECTYVNSTARCISTPIYENGKRVYTNPNLADIRKFCKAQVGTLWDEVKRFENPHRYYVDLSRNLWDTRSELLKKLSK